MKEIKRGSRFVDRTGEIFKTNQGYDVIITEYKGAKDCSIMFLTEKKVEFKNIRFKRIREGGVMYPYHPTVFNKGYLGEGRESTRCENGKLSKCYNTWVGVLERTYCEKLKLRAPSYKDIRVCEEWHNFQNFAQWFYENYNPAYMENWALDKDILVKGNKIYSPETCCFVPKEVNSLFKNNISVRGKNPIGVREQHNLFITGLSKNNIQSHIGYYKTPEEAFEAYKTEKEKYIKEVADKWKDLIDIGVYEAMYNYKVEIED